VHRAAPGRAHSARRGLTLRWRNTPALDRRCGGLQFGYYGANTWLRWRRSESGVKESTLLEEALVPSAGAIRVASAGLLAAIAIWLQRVWLESQPCFVTARPNERRTIGQPEDAPTTVG
jgi:hypothetical protein